MDTSSVDLPNEIIELILSECPVESVVRFKSVSKSWQSIISDPRFCRMHHIQRSKLPENRNKFLIWMKHRYESGYPLYMIVEDGKFRTESVMDDPSKGYIPLCSCGGLILFGDDYYDKKEYMFWNPLIKKHIIIPAFTPKMHPEAFRNRPIKDPYRFVHHLYFDSIADDYKILLSYRNWYTVYSCKNGIWEEVKDIPGDLDVTFNNACVDGCIYDKRNGEIVFFDARDGKLHKLPQPDEVERLVQVELEVVSGRLCLYGFSDDSEDKLQLWVMEENGSFDKCWRKLISMEKTEPQLGQLYPECLTNEDDVILWSDRAGKLYVYYSRKNCSFQEIDFTWHFFVHYFPHSENLYMPYSNTS